MAQFSVNAERFDPYKNFKFRVKWDGRYVAGVSKVGALKRTTDVVDALKAAGIEVERVIDSGKLRAAQTADLLAAAVAPLVELETSDRINPNDDPRGFDWEQATGGQDTLVVGHLPFMARLVSLLMVEDPDRPMTAYQPGSVVCLERDGDGQWQIDWMIRPHLLGQG